ncbi:ABC transporter substrate-binding protein [Kitasatospora purpeofusca]|uniref:ABC transporter substrate-binding protein n=1 Tax=Kitasatospora purpeofusca TaxID=67352 RepID=UPI00224FF6E1|nr:ABC transporter substrate-binding protein [Kitasatospora purpeofusca]MCX4754461.1 ABC transporter substrate-binding protein [Kitasatospora purpeofusca]WSR33881.1 ABC transporter substrate-binding protein [Kitasatospora purpeofusca]
MTSRRGSSQAMNPIAGRHNRRPIAAVATAAALLPTLFSASACGGPADAASNGGDLTVMTWAPSGTGSADRPGMTALAEAIGKDLNVKGGLGGRRLNVITCNEHNTSDGAKACAQQAVDAKAVAVLGSYSQFGDDFMPVLERAGIPLVGGYGLSQPEFSSPLSYPVGGGMPALIGGSGRQLVEAGCKAVSLIRPDTPAGDNLLGYLGNALKPAGIKLLDVKAPEKSNDYSPVVRKAIGTDQAGNCVTSALGAEPTGNLLDAFRRTGAKNTRIASVIGSVQQSVVDSTGGDSGPLSGAFVTGWYPPESAKIWDGLRTVIRADSGRHIDAADPGVQTTWVAYEVFKQVSERLTAAGQPVTSKAVTTLLDGGEPIDVGLTPPLNWATTNMLPSTESPRLVNTWVTFQVVKGGQMTLQRPGFVDVRWVLTGGKPPA